MTKYASMQVCNYASLQVCKYASMQICKYTHICKYVSMQVCSYMQRFSENSLPYSNLLYPTYPTNKSEAIYMSAVAAFFLLNYVWAVLKTCAKYHENNKCRNCGHIYRFAFISILAYLHACILAYMHTCILAYVHTCVLAY